MPGFHWACFVLLLLGGARAQTATGDSYSQKIDCFPGQDDCNKDYGDYDPPSDDYINKRIAPGPNLKSIVSAHDDE